MRNLDILQEAAICVSPSTVIEIGGSYFSNGRMNIALIPPQSNAPFYAVWIADDCEEYEFPTFGEACDFIAAELTLAIS